MLDTIGVENIGHTKMFLGNKNKKFLSYARCYSDRIITRFLLVATFLAGFVLKLTPTLVGALDTNQVSGDPGSCSFSSTVIAEHSTTIGLGENATDFGTTKITTVCQNSVNHQVYAIGYSNNTDGNTNLINSSNNLTIPTGTGTGNVSNWSMKISKDTSSYLPASLTIENSFDSNHVVPNETTLISSYDGATDGSTGSSILTTYSAKASTTQPGGNYAGKVKFTLTATLTYDITIKTSTGIEKVTLNGTECTSSTGCVVTGLVADMAYNLVATVADGYVFTGWGAVTTGSFGDSSLASTTYTIGDGSETLNASAGPAIQNLNTNDCTSTASTVYDSRDGHSYVIQRLLDGNCWMMENLDLGRNALTTNLTSENTNIATTVTATTFNSWKRVLDPSSLDDGAYYPIDGTDSTSNAPYGTLYNYYVASAGTTNSQSGSGITQYDICPAGWRLPTGGASGELGVLYNNYNSYALMRASIADNGVAFALAGIIRTTGQDRQGEEGTYWSNTRYGQTANTLAFRSNSRVFVTTQSTRNGEYSIRCILKNPTHTATISYGTGITDVTINGISIADNGTIELEEGTTYTINAVPSTGYSFSSWSTTSGTIGSTNTQSTTYSIGTVNDTISATATFTGTYIQNLSASNCTSTASTVFDSRDMHPYVIKRLDDGNCWMIDNLDLGRTDLTANLTSSNTNISTTIAAATFNSWRTTTGTQTYDAGEFLPLDGTDETSGTAYGTIYNYYAASAGTVSGSSNTIDATSDICPAGWRLPTGGNYDEFWKLYEYYNSNAIIRAPISDGGAAFARPGWFTNNGSQSKGTFGAYWSSTAAYSAARYNLSIGSSVTPSNNYDRGSGYSIRCILKEPKTIAKLMYLQDFNKLSSADVSTVLSSMSYNTTYNLKDVRDNHVYSVAKLKDGNIWMVENLDLGRTELLHGINDETSNVGSNVIVDTNTFSGWKVTAGTGTTTAGEFINIDGTDATSGTPYGTLYNYYAATAGTVSGSTSSNANYDICPAGWRMPYGGDYGEFAALYAISDYNSPATFRASIANGGAAFALPGSAWGGAPDYTGYFGSYWTSTMQNNQLTYRMSLNQSSVGPATSESRSSNVSVRCVAKIHNRTISDLTYMQEFAQLNAESKASVLDSMSNNVTYSLTDVRDNKTYRIAKFKDGNIWMAENLDLGRTDISVNLNSMNTNIDTPSISAATFNGWRKTTGTNTYTAGEFINVSGNDPTNIMPYGTLYNYYAASAGTINGSSNSSNASYDICPAGWRLPTGGSNSELYAIYENYPNYDSIRGTVAGGGFAITFPGYFYSTPADPGIPGPSGYARASYWSSSYYNSTNMSVLTVDINSGVTDITPADINTRGGGNPIRCIAK